MANPLHVANTIRAPYPAVMNRRCRYRNEKESYQ